MCFIVIFYVIPSLCSEVIQSAAAHTAGPFLSQREALHAIVVVARRARSCECVALHAPAIGAGLVGGQGGGMGDAHKSAATGKFGPRV